MDLLTQGLLGSAIALSVSRPAETKTAAIIGFVAGLATDADVFIRSDSDPLLNLEYHRHFTHSVFFIPIAALVISCLLWPLLSKQLPWRRLFLYSLAGYLLSGLLDACTSYGTRLLWPFSDDRISFNIISIIDPLFTLSLLLGVLITLKTRHKIFMVAFLMVSGSYLLLGWYQHHQVEKLSQQLATERGHLGQRFLVKPTLGNLFLWRSVYLAKNRFYVDAIRLNPLNGQSSIFPGDSIARFNAQSDELNIPPDSILQQDIIRFSSFTSDYLALHPLQQNTLIDVRYSNLPDSILPLWGIQFDPHQPQLHASYHLYRDASKKTREAFIAMLLNQ